MLENNLIKGEYYFNINIYTMFDVYNIQTKNHNLITKNGINFFLNKCVYNPTVAEVEDSETGYELMDEFGLIGKISVGTNSKIPTIDDTYLSESVEFNDTVVEIKDNQIILSADTDGNSIDGTTEIGVYTTKNILVSRDVHTEYVVPSTATVKLTYIFTLNQSDVSLELEEDEDD